MSQSDVNLSPQAKWWVIIGIGISAFMVGSEFYVVSIILPVVVDVFHSDFETMQWVLLIYNLALTVALPGVGKLGDLYSKKVLFLVGLLVFTLSSLLCGVAANPVALISFRALQGLGAAFVWALRTALIVEIFPKEERGQALGFVSGLSTLGVAIGPGLGGLILAWGGWHWIFWVQIPLGLIITIIVGLSMPELFVSKQDRSFDILGLGLIALTLICFVIGMARIQYLGSGEPLEILSLVIANFSFLAFLWWESRSAEPIIDLTLFRVSEFSLNLLCIALIYIVLGSMQLLLPLFLEIGQHYPSPTVGWLLTSMTLLSAIAAPISGILSDRVGERIINLVGFILVASGALLAATLSVNSSAIGFLERTIPIELGTIIFLAPTISLLMTAVPPKKLGTASSLVTLSRSLGLVSGVALTSSLLPTLITNYTNSIAGEAGISFEDFKQITGNTLDFKSVSELSLIAGIDMSFIVMALIALITIVLATLLWFRSASHQKKGILHQEFE